MEEFTTSVDSERVQPRHRHPSNNPLEIWRNDIDAVYRKGGTGHLPDSYYYNIVSPATVVVVYFSEAMNFPLGMVELRHLPRQYKRHSTLLKSTSDRMCEKCRLLYTELTEIKLCGPNGFDS